MKSISSVGIAVTSSFLLICHFCIFVSCNPCLNARNIGDYRRSVAYTPTARDPLLCDTDIDEDAWYRFDAHTGGKMPESCVSVLHCGTQLPIWMNGRHPNAADPGPRPVEVCAPYWRGKGGCCQWKEQISVKYCQNAASGKYFYVYQLKKPPFCYMSYCAGDGVPCEKDCAWNGILRKCTCPSYPVITEAPVLMPPRVITGTTKVTDDYGRTFFPTKFVVDCEVKYPRKAVDDGARFHVVFEIGGRYLTHFTVSSTNPVATLDEFFLVGHLGKELSCKVSSHWDSSDVGSRYLISNRRWFGFNPVDKADSAILYNLVVKEGEKVSLWMKPTFPITTRPCFDAPKEPCFYSSYRFQITKAEKAKLSDCEMVFLENSPRSIELEISPIPYVGARPKPVVWQLNFEPYSDLNLKLPDLAAHELPIFKDYRIQGVNIEVRDQDKPPQCDSSGDPHMWTFPNAAGTRNYYHVYGVGDFYLVRLQTRLLEVQVRHVPCNGHASCNCGVIVREGNSIIGITKCNQATPLLIKYELDKISPTGTIHTIPGGWKISLLSGIVIKATRFWGEYMSLYVTGLKSELAKYDGLCSATTVARHSYCTSDCDQYRVPASKSFFSVTKNNLPQCGNPFFVPECTCKELGPGETRNDDVIKIACDAPTGDYLLRIDMKKACSRRKRQAGEEEEEEEEADQGEDLISLDDFIDNTASNATTEAPLPEPKVEERWLNMGYRFFGHARSLTPGPVLSEEDGRRRCDDALRFSTTYDLCSSRVDAFTIVKSCALDVEILNDYAPAKSVPTQFELACLDDIRMSLETYRSSDLSGFEELKKLLERVEKLVCASQCSQHGRCVNSQCQCNAGFMGTDCSLKIGQVPVVQRVIMPVCDIRKHPCTQIHLVASDLTIPENVVCKMRSVDDLGDAVPAVQTSTPVISAGLVLCSLPSMAINVNESTDGISTTVFRVQVSISNDGQTYSKELPFTVLDSHCMECPASQDTPCQLKANTCSIGGRCYKAEESCPQDAARICNPAKCNTKFTGESSTNCDDGSENCT